MKFRAAVFSTLMLGATALTPPASQAAATSPAPSAAAGLAPIPITFEKFVLPNGLTVIVHEDHKTPVVAVGILYHVGSANETPGRTGFAHLFEHLMFNGSENANTDWFEQMNEVGASEMNGTTDNDLTTYYEVVPTVALDRVLWLEADRMANLLPAIDQTKLDEQRKVVQNEKRQRENQPLGKIGDLVFGGGYPAGHPYSWQPIGSMEDLNAASLDDVRAFFNTWYRPNNAVIVLSGDITVADARAKAEKYFASIPAGPALNRPEVWTAKRAGEKRAEIEVQTANPILFKFWNVPGVVDLENPRLKIAAETLGDGPNSFLHKRLVLERRVASEVQASIIEMKLGSIFQLNATARPGVTLQELEKALDEEMAAYLRTGPSAEEVERYKLSRYAGTVRAQAGTLGLAVRLAKSELFAGDPAFDTERQRRTLAATPSEVLESARKWLSDGALVVEAKPVPKYRASSEAVNQAVKPPIGTMANFDLPPLQHATLSNGIKVALAERHDVPTVSMTMYFDGGALPDRDPASVGLSEAFAMTMTGTRTRSREEISTAIEREGGSIDWIVAQEETRFTMNALKANLGPTLDLYADILENPVFPKDEWKRKQESFAAAYADSSLSPSGKFRRLTPKLIMGADHPYAARSTPESLDRITTSDLRGFYERWIRPDKATILIVGDTTLSEITPMLEERLCDWMAPPGPAPTKGPLAPPDQPSAPRVFLVDQPEAQSSIIRVMEVGVPRSDPAFEVLNVANTVVGGHFLSRLNMNLREDKGWSYGASSNLESAPLIGTLDAGAAVQVDKTADAMREIDRELREVGSKRPPTDVEIAAAKNALLLRMPALLEEPGGLKGFYADSFEYGLPEDYWNGYVGRIQALTPEQVRAAAKKLYRPGEFTWIVIGDLSKIEAPVRNLGFGDVQVLDAEGRRIR